jgi:hypothetical protein
VALKSGISRHFEKDVGVIFCRIAVKNGNLASLRQKWGTATPLELGVLAVLVKAGSWADTGAPANTPARISPTSA